MKKAIIDGKTYEMSDELYEHFNTLCVEIEQKDRDLKEVAEFVFNTLRALGVKDFDNIDNLGKTIIKGLPGIVTQAAMMPHKLQARFAHLESAVPMLEKYKHLIPA